MCTKFIRKNNIEKLGVYILPEKNKLIAIFCLKKGYIPKKYKHSHIVHYGKNSHD